MRLLKILAGILVIIIGISIFTLTDYVIRFYIGKTAELIFEIATMSLGLFVMIYLSYKDE